MSSLLSWKVSVGNVVIVNTRIIRWQQKRKCYDKFVGAERAVIAVIICTSLNILFHGVI